MSAAKKNIATPVGRKTSSARTLKQATTSLLDMLAPIIASHGMKGKSIFNVDVVMAQVSESRPYTADISLRITERKPSKKWKAAAIK